MAVSCPAWRWALARPPGGIASRWAHSARDPTDSAEMPSNWRSPCRVVLASPVGRTITELMRHPSRVRLRLTATEAVVSTLQVVPFLSLPRLLRRLI